MAVSYTTADLISSVKTKALVPSNQNTFTDAQILTVADEEFRTGLIPMIMDVREEFFVTFNEITLVSGQEEYDIPTRAMGMKLRDVTIVQGSGASRTEYSVPMVASDQVFDLISPLYSYTTGISFSLRGNKIVFSPVAALNSLSGTLRLYYYQRPGKFVETSDAARIDDIDTSLNQITLSNVPSAFVATATYDFIQSTPGFDTLAKDQTPTGVSGAVFTFSSLPDDLEVGDYLCLANESAIVQIAVELQPVLAQMTILRLLESIGDNNGAAIAQGKLDRLIKSTLTLISPRVDGEPKKVLNPYSPINGGGRYNRWWNR